MKSVVEAVKDKLDSACFVTTCKKGKCKVSLGGAPEPNLIVDLDGRGSPLGPQVTRCDFLFIAEGDPDGAGWVAPLELSVGFKNPSRLVKQLQAGANVAARTIDPAIAIAFSPIFVGRVKSGFREEFRKSARKIKFRGKATRIRNVHCGGRLETALR